MGKITCLDQKPTVKPTALTSEDLIALSVAWYRLRKNSQAAFLGIDNLTSTILAKEVTQDDRVVADQIRKYYSQKLMMIKLTKNNISKFREDLNVFIHSTSPTTDDKMLPLAYRLPEFYDYDTAFDLFKQEFNTKVTDHVYSYRTTQLTFLKSFTVGKSTGNWAFNSKDLFAPYYQAPLLPLIPEAQNPESQGSISSPKIQDFRKILR
jgi:hypothetical protein